MTHNCVMTNLVAEHGQKCHAVYLTFQLTDVQDASVWYVYHVAFIMTSQFKAHTMVGSLDRKGRQIGGCILC